MSSSTESSATAEPVRGCVEVCRRCATVAAAVRTVDDAWHAVSPHLRHCADHFTAFLRGLPDGIIDYDARDRDPSLEADPDLLVGCFEVVADGLLALPDDALGREVAVLQLAASDAASRPVASSLERELVFLSSHTIHHLALMSHIAADHGIEIPPEIGVAFSTAAHRSAVAAG